MGYIRGMHPSDDPSSQPDAGPAECPADAEIQSRESRNLLLLAAPLLGLASIAAAPDARRQPERIAGRLAVSVAVGSGLANLWGWQVSATVTAVAWWAGALLLSSVEGRRRPLADAAVWLAPVSAAVVWLHTQRPLLPLTEDPATALRVGAPLGDDAMRWAMPVGVPRHGTRSHEAVVWTDTDETAALVRFHTGIDAWTLGDCSRALPTTGGPVYTVSWSEGACVPPGWEATRIQRSPVHAPGGRDVGSWIWQELHPAVP